jgi:hypothetical protein
MSRRKEPAIRNELLDQLLAGSDAGSALAQGGLLDALKKAPTERALNAEMDHHLAGEDGAGNSRNGSGRKTITLSMPRCSAMAASASRPPVIKFTTLVGNSASRISSTIRIKTSGAFRADLNTTVFPQASAGTIFHAVTGAGPFHGMIAPTPTAPRAG